MGRLMRESAGQAPAAAASSAQSGTPASLVSKGDPARDRRLASPAKHCPLWQVKASKLEW